MINFFGTNEESEDCIIYNNLYINLIDNGNLDELKDNNKSSRNIIFDEEKTNNRNIDNLND